MADQSPSYGTNDARPPVLLVSITTPALIFEWATPMLLANYLASNRLPYQLVGRASFLGSIGVSFFPPISVFSHIASPKRSVSSSIVQVL